jgi:hypothetical protein
MTLPMRMASLAKPTRQSSGPDDQLFSILIERLQSRGRQRFSPRRAMRASRPSYARAPQKNIGRQGSLQAVICTTSFRSTRPLLNRRSDCSSRPSRLCFGLGFSGSLPHVLHTQLQLHVAGLIGVQTTSDWSSGPDPSSAGPAESTSTSEKMTIVQTGRVGVESLKTLVVMQR